MRIFFFGRKFFKARFTTMFGYKMFRTIFCSRHFISLSLAVVLAVTDKTIFKYYKISAYMKLGIVMHKKLWVGGISVMSLLARGLITSRERGFILCLVDIGCYACTWKGCWR